MLCVASSAPGNHHFPIHMRASFRLWPWLVAALVAPTVLFAQTPSTVVDLPTFTVTEARDLPEPEAWRYARVGPFEVLSNASDRTAARLVEDFQRFQQAISVAWPAAANAEARPTSLIICARKNAFAPFRPSIGETPDAGAITATYSNADMGAIALDLETKQLDLYASTPVDAAESVAPVSATDPGASATGGEELETIGGGLPTFVVDHYTQLYRAYIHYVLGQTKPRAPAWLDEGLAQILMKVQFSPTRIALGKIEDPNEVSPTGTLEDRDFNQFFKQRSFMPLAEMLAVDHDSATARQPLGSVWAKQCYAFVHWGLFGEDGRNQPAFLKFVAQSYAGKTDEATIKACFGKSSDSLLTDLRGYVGFTVYRRSEYRTAKGQKFPEPTPVVFRDATQGEVGRIKGEAFQLAGNSTLARTTLIDAYRRGERDPELLASLGLQEQTVGERARAITFLDAAIKAKTTRARAYVERARLRLNDTKPAANTPPAKLTTEQYADVTGWLRTAEPMAGSSPDLYYVLGETLERAPTPPTRDDVVPLVRGAVRFPKDMRLVFIAARQAASVEMAKEARALCEHGLKYASAPTLRERFQTILAALPPPPSTEKPAAPKA